MALTSTLIQPISKPVSSDHGNQYPDAVLSALLLAMYAAGSSKKAMRKLKLNLLWNTFKLKAQSLLGKKAEISTRVLIYILLAVVFLALLAINAYAALAVAVLALVLILTGAV